MADWLGRFRLASGRATYGHTRGYDRAYSSEYRVRWERTCPWVSSPRGMDCLSRRGSDIRISMEKAEGEGGTASSTDGVTAASRNNKDSTIEGNVVAESRDGERWRTRISPMLRTGSRQIGRLWPSGATDAMDHIRTPLFCAARVSEERGRVVCCSHSYGAGTAKRGSAQQRP